MNEPTIEGEFAAVGRWTLERHSAAHPEEGTKFITCVTLYLPVDMNKHLRDDLQFGLRVNIFSERLRASWGNPTVLDNKQYRSRRAYANGMTWHEAFVAAKEMIHSEEQRLLAAIQERK